MNDERPLSGRVALVAGATRGAGRAIAVELARAGAYVYATGRSSRVDGPSEIERPEMIEETGERMATAGGDGVALRVDHLEPTEVEALVQRIRDEHGRLDVLVNDIFGGDRYAQFGKKVWEHDLSGGLRMLRMGIDTHAITSHHALGLMIERPGGLVIEMTDGTFEYNTRYRDGVGMYYDLVKAAVQRLTLAQSEELKPYEGTAVAVTPGWLRSEMMLQIYGVTDDTWHDAVAKEPHFAISESPTYVARGVAALAADADRARYSGRSVSSGELARTYDLTDVDGSRPNAWAYVVEVQDTGRPANVAGYR
ncbi:SDR family oxidoreductase [Solicola gregarius]|uniref:SDR family oxidoreductase n=1 Tax=Solicola gregarius TaxID=2908642 RepID=A0AA46YJB9_9ACTN|nr:SDR family oxidoreductase [Solicola gregarius]UYM04167.1 SDR family oxidoreductase [Solicola gregarius]